MTNVEIEFDSSIAVQYINEGPPPDHPQRQFHHFSHLLSSQSDNGLPRSPQLSQQEICYGRCPQSGGILEPRKGYVTMSA